MTRTALSPRLSAHLAEPFLEIHPTDAARLGISHSDLVTVESPTGCAILRERITDAVQPRQVFASMHWTGETAPSARIDAVIPAATDPVSGQPESKAAVVNVTRFEAAWYGFAVSTEAMALTSDYWALARTEQGYRAEVAGCSEVEDWEAEARRLFSLPDATVAAVTDDRRGSARVVLYEEGLIKGALFVGREPVALMRDYLATLPGTAEATALTGRPPAGVIDPGPILCSCFGVGVNTIVHAIETQGTITVEAIGEALGAGTNCGSCRPEISALLHSMTRMEAAE